MARFSWLSVLLAAVLVASCGGSPTAPSGTPTAQPPVVTPPAPSTRSFSFHQVNDMSMPSNSLEPWALREGNTAGDVKMAAFCGVGVTVGGARENGGLRPLLRLAGAGEMSIVYSPSLGARAVGVLNALSARTPKLLSVGTSPGVGAQFNIVIDSTLGYEALTVLNISGSSTTANVIAGGQFVFKSEESITSFTALHEYGHGLGLCHENRPGVMSGEGTGLQNDPSRIVFALHELDNISAMYRLASGVLHPDAPATVSAAKFTSRGTSTISIAD